jgi:uncharacterized repeat protein (TIGR03803 family)
MKMLRVLWMTLVTAMIASVLAPCVLAQSHYKVIHRFNNNRQHPDGTSPFGALIFDAAGNLYGTTEWGYGDGAYWHGCGSFFKFARNADGSWIETFIDGDFLWTDPGAWPIAGLIFDAHGNLYGTTAGDYQCCGRVFAGTPNLDGTWTWTTLHWFTGGEDGARPYSSLILDAEGNVYGTTVSGGAYGAGVVFKLTSNGDGTWTETVLHHFTGGADGANPYASLIFDSAGNLYGTAVGGGAYGRGVVFKLTPNPDTSWTEQVLWAFRPGKDGANPYSRVLMDAAGNLYGTTYNGGTANGGVVFKLATNPDGTWTYRRIHVFSGVNGMHPYAGVVMDKAGNLYGTTVTGGSADDGIVYKLVPTASGIWATKLLHTFAGTPAKYPYGDLLLNGAGNVYGTTAGTTGDDCSYWTACGTVFELTQ